MENNPHSQSAPFLGRLIGMIGRAMSRSFTERMRAGGHEMSMEEWIVMVHLWEIDGQNQARLGEYAGQHKTAMTRAIDRLEELNYVLRVPDQTDRRNKLIYLTNAGKELRDELLPIADDVQEEALSSISPADIQKCRKVLQKILVNIRHYL